MFQPLLDLPRAVLTPLTFFAVYFVAITIGRLLKRRAGVRFGVIYQLFCLAIAFYAALAAYGVHPEWEGHLGSMLVLLGTGVFITLLNRYLWDYYFETRRGTVIPRLLREFVAAVIFLAALLLVLSIGYHAETELKGLLAGSGVAAIVLAFGMQNLLSSIVAGASLQIRPPYKLGDWLKVGEHIGEVVEIGWGDTRLRTTDAVSIEIPNNKMVNETIINLSSPTALHAMRVSVGADYAVPPNRVKDALRRAASRAEGIELSPPPKAYLKEFGDSAITYEVKFWMTTHATYNDVCDAIRTNIWYEFRRRKINIPFPMRTLQLERKPVAASQAQAQKAAAAILRSEPLFACLSEEQIGGLLHNAEINQFGRGEAIIEEATEGESMFILLRGSAQVSVSKGGALIRVGVLREGDCFGEMSLLTGEPRTATVRAENDCEVLEISKGVMGELLRSSPQCLTELSGLLARRKLETEGLVKEAAAPEDNAEKEREYAASFLRRVRSFFEL
jgi:small-conductance mechanosensitive channel/CRP-like cAMP-binding protein